MRGSAYCMIDVWIVNQRNRKSRPQSEVMYGHSAVGEMNNNMQREEAFKRCINQALKQYRNKHHLSSDDEINYELLSSGIINVDYGERRYYKNRISPSKKRAIHRETYLGKDRTMTLEQQQKELYGEQYSGKKSNIEYNKYVIDTSRKTPSKKKR